jgi:DNA ligase (NAD+)
MAGEFLMCLNQSSCQAQVEGRIATWIKKLEVKEFGDKLITRLVENKLCLTIPDLYKLGVKELSEVERMGVKSATKCIDNLHEKTNGMTLDTFLGSLSIPLIGRTTIRLLMDVGYDTLDTIMNIDENQLATIRGIGPEKARALLNGLKDNAKIINELIELGVTPMKTAKKETNGKLSGKHICITGKTEIKRETLAEMITEVGGVFDRAVGKETNYLVVADPTSTTIKTQKAKAKGVEIIAEKDLMAMMSEI